MKNTIKLLYILSIAMLLSSCNDEDIMCNTDDHNNPITTVCDNGLLVIQSALNPATQVEFSLDSIAKPVTIPLVFNNIRTDIQQDFFSVGTRPSNYDAYNSVTNTYFIEFPIEQRIYKYDINTQDRQEFIIAGFYSAPVFNNGNLYAITIDNFGFATNPANYSIETINQNDGSLTNITTNSFPLLSSFDWENMSSTSNGNTTIYFVSGTNLVQFNTSTSVASHTELVPTFDASDNNQRFYGLEYRNNGNLLAIRKRIDNVASTLELVEINSNNLTTTPTVVYDFMSNGIDVNQEFYSTTYDVCDDTYYITSGVPGSSSTIFYELDLATGIVQTENISSYLIGIESKNNR